MLRNYFIVAVRNLARNKIFSIIHILGLSIGLSASIVIFLIVHYEFSFDKFEPDGDLIYRVVMDFKFSDMKGHSAAVPAPLAMAIQEEVTGVAATVPVMSFQGDGTVNVTIVRNASNKPVVFKEQTDIIFTTGHYFDLLPIEWIVGSKKHSLSDPFTVVLNETRAHQYFPDLAWNEIVGREIMYDKDLRMIVTGIVRDLHETSDLISSEFISYPTIAKTALQQNFMMNVWNDWMAYSKTYVKLSPANNAKGVEQQLNALLKKYNKDANRDSSNTRAFALQPLSDIHFNTAYASSGQRTANMQSLYGLLAIAAFLLMLGCINFINLNTAQASSRAKEIGVRKTIGSSKKQLIIQFLCETFCVTLIATVVSVSITPFLLQIFSDFIPPGVKFEIWNDPTTVLFLLILTLLVSFLSGFYPALVLSGLRPVLVLKNSSFGGSSSRRSGLRKVLTVSQFMIAQFFIIAAFMVSKQVHFSLHEEPGYRKEAILNFEMPHDTVADHRDMLRNQIKNIPGVQMVSTGFLPPAMEGGAYANYSYQDDKEEAKVSSQIRWGDPNYLSLYNINIVAGRNINGGANTNELIINEAYAKALGFQNPADALNKELTAAWGEKTPIVGVMRDFHESSFHRPIGPLLFRASATGNTFHVALSPQQPGSKNWEHAIKEIESVFRNIYPEEEFIYRFFDDTIARFYMQEQKMGSLLNWAMGLSIFISSLGLLGLVIYTSETRRKEIGIRKILGASVLAIISLLSREFVKLVVIAFVIAAPFTWWAVDTWLQSFAYKTSIDWWVFGVSGLLLIGVAVLTLGIQTVKTAMSNPVNSLRAE